MFAIMFFLLLMLYNPCINFAQTNDDITSITNREVFAPIVILNDSNNITPTNNIEFSDSVVILNGSNNIFVETADSKNRGIRASIDWDQIPDIGFPKEEVHTITIIRRSKASFNSTIILLSPSIWRFEASSWTFDYHGSIPYLENLEFLPAQDSANLTTSSKIELAQNPIGYYQDKVNLTTGFYQAMNELSDNLVSSIFIISKEENILIDKYKQQLDAEIMKDQTPTNTNNISEEKLTNLTNIIEMEEELTNLKTESEVKNYVTNTTDVQDSTTVEQVPVVENRRTFNTSIDKKQQNVEK